MSIEQKFLDNLNKDEYRVLLLGNLNNCKKISISAIYRYAFNKYTADVMSEDNPKLFYYRFSLVYLAKVINTRVKSHRNFITVFFETFNNYFPEKVILSDNNIWSLFLELNEHIKKMMGTLKFNYKQPTPKEYNPHKVLNMKATDNEIKFIKNYLPDDTYWVVKTEKSEHHDGTIYYINVDKNKVKDILKTNKREYKFELLFKVGKETHEYTLDQYFINKDTNQIYLGKVLGELLTNNKYSIYLKYSNIEILLYEAL